MPVTKTFLIPVTKTFLIPVTKIHPSLLTLVFEIPKFIP
jgi:hypothetical protein